MGGPLLVVAHEATRTGSPRVLIELLRFARPRLDVPIAINLEAGGPLSDELMSLATTTTWTGDPVAVLVNGSSAAAVIEGLDPSIPTAIYVHEEGDALRALPAHCVTALSRFDMVLCVSERSRSGLVEIGVNLDRVEILPPVIRLPVPIEPHATRSDGEFLDGINPTMPVAVGCGEATWRKGADLFVDVAWRTNILRPTKFVWIGRRPRSFARGLDYDTRATNMADMVTWAGEVGDVAPLFARADVLVMTSREDPQPLVPLEAAAQGTPTAGFAVGGIAELGERGLALTVPFPDTDALARTIGELLDDGNHREQLAADTLAYARSNHSIERLGARFVELVTQLTESRWP